FAARFGMHLKAGLLNWLTGALPGVYIPQSFTFGEIVKFVFSVLDITWQNIRQKLVKLVGEPAVKALETIKEFLSNLQEMVIGGITDFVTQTVIGKAIPKLLSFFIPGAGFISAI